MSIDNCAEIIIEIKMKNNAIIKTKISIDGDILPMGMNPDRSMSPKIEEINSGDMLLQYIYKSYFPCSSLHWTDDDSMHFEDEYYYNGRERILKMQNFHLINEIKVKEVFYGDEEFRGYLDAATQFVINSKNCYFIDTRELFTEMELQSKKPTLPSSITSIGENAFLGCDNLNIFVEENTPAHLCLEKHGMPHYVINKTKATAENSSTVVKKLHFHDKLPNYDGLLSYDTLRVVTKGDVYILFLLPAEGQADIGIDLDPDDYMPKIVDGKLLTCDNGIEINSISKLATALFFVLSDKIDFEMLKTYLNYSTGKITSKDAVEVFLNCHKSEYLNAFKKGSFDAIRNLNLSSMNESQQKSAILNVVEEKFKSILPNFQELIVPFIEVCNNVNKIRDILFVEVAHGIVGENKLEDEELWESNFKLDFSLLR